MIWLHSDWWLGVLTRQNKTNILLERDASLSLRAGCDGLLQTEAHRDTPFIYPCTLLYLFPKWRMFEVGDQPPWNALYPKSLARAPLHSTRASPLQKLLSLDRLVIYFYLLSVTICTCEAHLFCCSSYLGFASWHPQRSFSGCIWSGSVSSCYRYPARLRQDVCVHFFKTLNREK